MKGDGKDLVPISILHDFAGRIERLGINYMLSGSMALAAYSIYRYTADIDVVIELDQSHVARMVEAFEPDYYISENSARLAVTNEQMFNVINIATAFKVDCIIRKSSEFQRQAFERRYAQDIAGRQIFVITIEDLILSKLNWSVESRSEKQMTDIRSLLMADLDEEYVERWANKMGMKEFLNECRIQL